MPVIINEFSVVSEPPAPTRGEGPAPAPAPQPAPALAPKELERILKFVSERWQRLLAD